MKSFLEDLASTPNRYRSSETVIALATAALRQGVNHLDSAIAVRDGEEVVVYDRVCDHRGGRLISRPDGKIVCPLHGWSFDALKGEYRNVRCAKTPLATAIIGRDDPELKIPASRQRRVLPAFAAEHPVRVRYLNHACVVVEAPGVKFALDPWLTGPAFCRGWWLATPSPADAFDELDACDFIYVSHNHPDHLHAETLSHVRKDMPILTGGFQTGSSRSRLAELGFGDVRELDFARTYVNAEAEYCFGAVKSGDFRDDSGFVFRSGAFTAVFTVDSNFLDFYRFPEETTLLATSFASGASGFPLCFDTVPESRKRAIVTRNRNAAREVVRLMIDLAQPRYHMPYAGMFAERAPRDAGIAARNLKNRIADLAPGPDARHALIDVGAAPERRFIGTHLAASGRPAAGSLPGDNVAARIRGAKRTHRALSDAYLEQYFRASGFDGDLTLLIELCDDDFGAGDGPRHRVDFRRGRPALTTALTALPDPRDINRAEGIAALSIRVRREAFAEVLSDLLPWEDMLIGFQCRIDRAPDVYNVDFWGHFTNVYVKRNAVRMARDCGGCERIAQGLAAAF